MMLPISLPNEPIRPKHVTIYWTKHDSKRTGTLVLTEVNLQSNNDL
jgi:hypothetical protein